MRKRYAAGEFSYDVQGLRKSSKAADGGRGARPRRSREPASPPTWSPQVAACGVGSRRRPGDSEPAAIWRPSGEPRSCSASTRPPRARGRNRRCPRASTATPLYADLNTSAPQLKRELADAVPVPFADVALIGAVPSLGLHLPRSRREPAPGASPSSSSARHAGRGRRTRPGDAAGLKLLRSVFMKGIAAAAIEASRPPSRGRGGRVLGDIAGVIGEPLLDRLLSGSRTHATRRSTRCRRPPPTSRSSASSPASPRPRPSGCRARDAG